MPSVNNSDTVKSENKEHERAKEKDYSINEILKHPIQIVFFTAIIIVILMLVPFTYSGYKFIEVAKEDKPEGYEWPSFWDMKLMIISAIVINLTETAT